MGRTQSSNCGTQHSRADSTSVIYDALQAAIARKVDILIANALGRLRLSNVEELKKVCRVMKRSG
ncbi:MAG: hypothetical protein R3E08_11185 [Thiotrichaceae bacterium]